MKIKKVLLTGGAGYAGTVLVPKLLRKGYLVKVIDWYIFGRNYFHSLRNNSNLIEIKGDIRDKKLLAEELKGSDAVIHLACIANDFSDKLNSNFRQSDNYDATVKLFDLSQKLGIKRFIYVSSSSVYGLKNEKEVTEDLELAPITEYARLKAKCDEYILVRLNKKMTTIIFRPAAICGYSPRLRLDLSVNTLTIHALVNRIITVYGGQQQRSQIHIEDITDLYLKSLEYPDEKINGKVYNVTSGNYKIIEIARLIKKTLNDPLLQLVILPQTDDRSYHISDRKIRQELGFKPKYSVKDAIIELKNAYERGLIKNPLTDDRFYNLRTIEKEMIKLNKAKYL